MLTFKKFRASQLDEGKRLTALKKTLKDAQVDKNYIPALGITAASAAAGAHMGGPLGAAVVGGAAALATGKASVNQMVKDYKRHKNNS